MKKIHLGVLSYDFTGNEFFLLILSMIFPLQERSARKPQNESGQMLRRSLRRPRRDRRQDESRSPAVPVRERRGGNG